MDALARIEKVERERQLRAGTSEGYERNLRSSQMWFHVR